jgi:hypothetical protein
MPSRLLGTHHPHHQSPAWTLILLVRRENFQKQFLVHCVDVHFSVNRKYVCFHFTNPDVQKQGHVKRNIFINIQRMPSELSLEGDKKLYY